MLLISNQHEVALQGNAAKEMTNGMTVIAETQPSAADTVEALSDTQLRSISRTGRFFRFLVHRALSSLEDAQLIITDADGTTSFGSRTSDDDPHGHVRVLDSGFYRAVVLRGDVGGGEPSWTNSGRPAISQK